MKIEANLTLVKGRAATGPGPRRPGSSRKNPTTPGATSLISQENRQAWHLDLDSLEEAQRLLGTVKHYLQTTQGDNLAGVHHVDSQCLVRLR
ncbi:MAG: hypothetical protein AB1491_03385 [Thermodesulfobacteriota bacterium]